MRQLQILIIEDSKDDVELVLRSLRKSDFEISYRCVEDASSLTEALKERDWDAIISDYSLPQFDALAALEIVKQYHVEIPFILVSGTIGEETAVALMKAGASDYIMKERLNRLLPALERELRDADERKRNQQIKIQLEEQLRQAQKIEAIGQLAGGIAHDFNNILMAITAYCQLMLFKLPASSPLCQDILGIQKTAEQGAALSRQLLAFSRRQVLIQTLLRVDQVLKSVEPMLRRLIREDVELIVSAHDDVGMIKADAGQIAQAIMNLIVNARDAMPEGGSILVEAFNESLNEEFVRQHLGSKVGDYVVIRVSDTGIGMDEDTISRIFEPFFTTKDAGKGTGLGLSTVYGIVKQSGGYIWVNSEVGKGSVFTIYLPRLNETLSEQPQEESVDKEPDVKGGRILVVDDNESVCNAVATFLTLNGFEVLQAKDGEQALKIVEQIGKPIDILITDLVMPHMSGRQLADQMLEKRNGIKILFMSGYTEEPSVLQGNLGPESVFLQKPVLMDTLLQTVRELLRAN